MRDPSRAMLWLVMIAFVCVAFVLSAAADLEDVYPAEMFPTEVRASGVGIAAGISRIGAAISTFLLPICLEKLGIGPTMFLLAGVVFFGFAIYIPWAPETRGVDLDEAAEVPETPAAVKV
jgi:putative MFS transporter